LLGLGIFIIFTESGILRPVISKLQDGDVTVTIPNTAVTTRDASVVGDDQSEHATAANTAVSKTAAIDLSKLPHIPPSRMGTKYHEMWDLSTSTIDIPDEYRNPFNTTIGGEQGSGSERLPRPSLKILEEVIHGEKYRAEFEAVEAYMEATDPERKPTNGTTTAVSPPSCLVPDLQATRDLARRTVELRETVFPKPEKIWHWNIDKENKNKWQYKEMTLPLPILNGECEWNQMESNVNVVRFLGTFLPVLPRFLSFTHAYIIITIDWLRCWAHTNTKLVFQSVVPQQYLVT
jgi:hypothetical protein